MRLPLLTVTLLATLTAVSAPVQASGEAVVRFHSMIGVDGQYLGGANAIRGVPGGGRPWVLEMAKGTLDQKGRLDVRVKGLIIPESDGAGFNPAPFFRAVVSCLSVDSDGNPTTVNRISGNGAEVMIGNPANGDAHIKAKDMLADPCVAPMVFITSPGGAWFSVTGIGSLAP
ncbi:hypothetical protein [Motiliproteus sediminis]|uniref:hypothetical protein n=1 Tax=Motiliproteus sediminis TaxID=1468178 RepID=UPI001AEFDB6A|nr:hypothetical protein [Motiliproteus sediminis]